MILTLKKVAETSDSTVSTLTYKNPDGIVVNLSFVIEDGKRVIKEHGKTRIPAGRYQIKPRYSGRHYEQYTRRFGHKCTYQIMNVPGFQFIMIHIGNTPKDTEGCLLICQGYKYDKVNQHYIGVESKNAYLKLYDFLHKVAFVESSEVYIDINR
jgi:hypothetical protein